MFDFVPLKPIPPEQDGAIQAAVWALIKSSHQGQQVPDSLYHYTDAAGLKGIVESGVIRATHIAFMNDASEYLHAVSLLTDAIAEARMNENDPLRVSLLKEISDPVALTRPKDVGPYFVACFSTLRDLVKVNVLLTRAPDVAVMNRLYAEAFGPAPYPARTTCVVQELPDPKMLVEIQGVASLKA